MENCNVFKGHLSRGIALYKFYVVTSLLKIHFSLPIDKTGMKNPHKNSYSVLLKLLVHY